MNSYLGSIGNTTVMNNKGSTGVFTFQFSYGLRDIADGAVNTLAFTEMLCGDQIKSNGKPGDGVGSVGDTSPTAQLLDTTSIFSPRSPRPWRVQRRLEGRHQPVPGQRQVLAERDRRLHDDQHPS